MTVGDEEAEEGLLACLAKGADRAVRVWDEDAAGRRPTRGGPSAGGAVGRESPDLVLCGVQSSDAVTGSTGTALAGFLDLPRVAVVTSLSYDAGSSTLTVDRELEGGLVEVVRIGLPALLTIQTGINEPRYANLRAIKQAREKPLERARSGGGRARFRRGRRRGGLAHGHACGARARRGRADARRGRRTWWRRGSWSSFRSG